MLMSVNFENNLKCSDGKCIISREGITSKLVLPENIHKGRILYSVDLDASTRQITFTEGDSVYILADEFGCLGGPEEEVEVNIVFVEGGLLIELISGKIVLRGEDGDIFYVDELGDIDYPRANAKIYWAKANEIYTNLMTVTKYQFNSSDETAKLYTDNFVYDTVLHYARSSRDNNYFFKTRVMEYFSDLALGLMEFINYGSEEYEDEDDDHVDISELDQLTDGEEEEEIEIIDDLEELGFDMNSEEHEDDF